MLQLKVLRLKKLEFEHKKQIQDFTSKFLPYSDFNFISMWSNNTEEDWEFFIDNKILVIKMKDYLTNNLIYSFLTNIDSSKIAEELLELSNDRILYLVPETSINSLNNKSIFNTYEDRDNFDYVLSTEEVSLLNGRFFEHARWHINYFSRNFFTNIKITNNISDEEKEQIKNVCKIWALRKIDEDSTHELNAISRLLDYSSFLDLYNLGIWQGNNLIGFVLFERLSEDYAIGHFMKADSSFKGIYDVLYFETAKYLSGIGCKFLNYEQDLGIEKLRASKMMWHPVNFLRKYIIYGK